MAKINARGTHQVGPTLYTERDRPASAYDVERRYYEAWRLRSDGAVLTRIIWTAPTALKEGLESIGRETKHTSGFRIMGRLSAETMKNGTGEKDLRGYLGRKGFRIVKESWR